MLGASFMTVVLLNVSVHLFPMMKQSCAHLGALFKKIKAKCFDKKLPNQKIAEKTSKDK